MHFDKKTPNYLLNGGRYTRKDTASRFGDTKQSHARALTQIADDARSIASSTGVRMTPLAGKDSRKGSSLNKGDKIYGGDIPV
jgi:hypothetical protein